MLDSLLLSHIPYDLTFSHDSQATRSSIYVKSIFMSPRQCLDLVTRMSQRPVEPVDKLLLRVINKSEIKIFQISSICIKNILLGRAKKQTIRSKRKSRISIDRWINVKTNSSHDYALLG